MNAQIVVKTLISRILLLILLALCFVPGVIFMALPARWRYGNPFYYWFASFFYWAVLKCSFLKIRYHGLENIPKTPAIFAGNHQSSFDIPIMGSLVDAHPHIWLATSTLLTSPMLYIPLTRMTALIDMSSPQKGMRSLINAIKLVDEPKRHTMIFPEGGRFVDGIVHEFYGGFVIIAKKLGRPVIPVYMTNLHKIYPPHSFWVYSYPVDVVVGEPMYYQEHDTDELFKQRVYDWFLRQQKQRG